MAHMRMPAFQPGNQERCCALQSLKPAGLIVVMPDILGGDDIKDVRLWPLTKHYKLGAFEELGLLRLLMQVLCHTSHAEFLCCSLYCGAAAAQKHQIPATEYQGAVKVSWALLNSKEADLRLCSALEAGTFVLVAAYKLDEREEPRFRW
ncbi:uncharacterized protein PITG_08921 [Phytophthora infestans T30-4]|uniref:Uncharacterized protein n=2 Tax=Phytophthora infestans TaxID=4787 RepID=D0NDH9_PHYIT|nr:uncharacterized protein PITG_08921 [Phytophthora infestans T30-4]EEY56136.1 hypothetical protein PITG_08921 [Phytophthora infestans T30-4]|eukprot:XP_002902966.1 hypothetical protein PITG_08921 [Phytophthora infestans T30-4]